eukprot:COSAG06_NODE_7223_length_2581_cov_2.433118_1_plen_231_part_10
MLQARGGLRGGSYLVAERLERRAAGARAAGLRRLARAAAVLHAPDVALRHAALAVAVGVADTERAVVQDPGHDAHVVLAEAAAVGLHGVADREGVPCGRRGDGQRRGLLRRGRRRDGVGGAWGARGPSRLSDVGRLHRLADLAALQLDVVAAIATGAHDLQYGPTAVSTEPRRAPMGVCEGRVGRSSLHPCGKHNQVLRYVPCPPPTPACGRAGALRQRLPRCVRGGCRRR